MLILRLGFDFQLHMNPGTGTLCGGGGGGCLNTNLVFCFGTSLFPWTLRFAFIEVISQTCNFKNQTACVATE